MDHLDHDFRRYSGAHGREIEAGIDLGARVMHLRVQHLLRIAHHESVRCGARHGDVVIHGRREQQREQFARRFGNRLDIAFVHIGHVVAADGIVGLGDGDDRWHIGGRRRGRECQVEALPGVDRARVIGFGKRDDDGLRILRREARFDKRPHERIALFERDGVGLDAGGNVAVFRGQGRFGLPGFLGPGAAGHECRVDGGVGRIAGFGELEKQLIGHQRPVAAGIADQAGRHGARGKPSHRARDHRGDGCGDECPADIGGSKRCGGAAGAVAQVVDTRKKVRRNGASDHAGSQSFRRQR